MHDTAENLLANTEMSEHYLGIGKEEDKNYRESKSYKRRQRIVW